MPPVNAPANVLVTGASGFIGCWVTRKLLERQYFVRAAVRSLSKGEYLRDLFADHAGKFEFVIVPDIAADGAFDNALKDIHAVHHIASPLAGNPDEFVKVAVNGTLSLLKSVAQYGKDIQRVILTSSGAALMEPKKPEQYPYEYTEEDWNLSAPKAAENKDATPEQKYYASKALSEKAAWEFAGKMNMDLVTLLPPMVIGPVIHEIQSLDKLNYSSAMFYDGILHEKPVGSAPWSWVDVRDIADAHILVMEKEDASGQRFIISAGLASWQLIYDTLNDMTPKLPNIPQGQVGNKESVTRWTFSAKKIESLGMKFMTLGQSARDTVISMQAHGW